MKNIFFTLGIIVIATFTAIANTKNTATDTIFANITALAANDTIIAHANDPWFVILDVRTPSEYAVKHLAEGVDIDFYLPTFATILATLNRSKIYVLHCASGGRSAQVFTMMQNLHFSKVYNMTGGINAWTSAGLPVTTSEAPATGILCDTIASFNNIALGQTDSILLTITNAANSVLSFNSITDLSGTNFSTNFDTGINISGARDYSFFIYYNPIDTNADSLIFTIAGNGGTMYFYLFGTAGAPSFINKTDVNSIIIYNDVTNSTISFKLNYLNVPAVISVFDINGGIFFEKLTYDTNVKINYSIWKTGLYLLNIKNANESKTYKMPLLH